jgi:hypothetical protein
MSTMAIEAREFGNPEVLVRVWLAARRRATPLLP